MNEQHVPAVTRLAEHVFKISRKVENRGKRILIYVNHEYFKSCQVEAHKISGPRNSGNVRIYSNTNIITVCVIAAIIIIPIMATGNL